MLKTKLVAVAVASVAALAVAPSAHAATDYFMKVESLPGDAAIKGETLDKEFPGAIAIKSFSWGAENPTSIGSAGGGAGTGKAVLNELTVEKAVDSTTPAMFQRLAQGRHFASVEIIARKAGGAPGASLLPTRYSFQTVFVKSQEQSGAAADDAPQEKLTFLYGAVAQQAVRQSATGAVAGTSLANWNQVTNSPIKDALPAWYK
jgi:type VI secretion system secreted protein Hcp